MRRYKVNDGVLIEDPRGGFVIFDDVVEKLFLVQAENQQALISAEKTIIEALKEIRELKKTLPRPATPSP